MCLLFLDYYLFVAFEERRAYPYNQQLLGTDAKDTKPFADLAFLVERVNMVVHNNVDYVIHLSYSSLPCASRNSKLSARYHRPPLTCYVPWRFTSHSVVMRTFMRILD